MEHPDKKTQKPRRAHRFSRRARALMLLAGTAVLALGFVLALPLIRARFPVPLAAELQANLTYRTLDTGDVAVLDSVAVSHKDGDSYLLRYRDGKLYLAGADADGADAIINESYSDAIVQAATDIAVEDTVTEDATEVEAYLADMGLEPPAITVEVSYANGRKDTLQLGALVPGTTYHYYRWSGAPGVYMCDTGIYEAFEYTAQMLLPVEQPSLVPALVDRLSLTTQAAGSMEFTFTGDGTGGYVGTMRAPYHYPMDSEATTTLMNALKNFRLGTEVGPADAAHRTAYGFDKPTAVLDAHQQEGLYAQIDAQGVLGTVKAQAQTVRFTLGAKDGDFFYYCEYAGVCYRVSSFLVATLIQTLPTAYLTRAPADMGAANIASITAQLGTGALDVRATYSERVKENNQIETDAQGNIVYDVSVTANGVAITADAFTSLVTRLKQMTVSGRLDEAVQPSGTPRWQMTLTTTGGATRTLAAYPLDAFSDMLVVDGVALHYLNAEAIQIALAELYPAVGTTP